MSNPKIKYIGTLPLSSPLSNNNLYSLIQSNISQLNLENVSITYLNINYNETNYNHLDKQTFTFLINGNECKLNQYINTLQISDVNITSFSIVGSPDVENLYITYGLT